jgi:hypothetical protein
VTLDDGLEIRMDVFTSDEEVGRDAPHLLVRIRGQRDPIHAVVVRALTDVLGLFEREPERFVHFLDSLVDGTKERLVPSCAKGGITLGGTHSILTFQVGKTRRTCGSSLAE